ncbi:hypothetical protein D3C81_1809210 [compost metagenome]
MVVVNELLARLNLPAATKLVFARLGLGSGGGVAEAVVSFNSTATGTWSGASTWEGS